MRWFASRVGLRDGLDPLRAGDEQCRRSARATRRLQTGARSRTSTTARVPRVERVAGAADGARRSPTAARSSQHAVLACRRRRTLVLKARIPVRAAVATRKPASASWLGSAAAAKADRILESDDLVLLHEVERSSGGASAIRRSPRAAAFAVRLLLMRKTFSRERRRALSPCGLVPPSW